MNDDGVSGEVALGSTLARLAALARRHRLGSLVALSAVAGSLFGATIAHQASLTDEAKQVQALADFRSSLA